MLFSLMSWSRTGSNKNLGHLKSKPSTLVEERYQRKKAKNNSCQGKEGSLRNWCGAASTIQYCERGSSSTSTSWKNSYKVCLFMKKLTTAFSMIHTLPNKVDWTIPIPQSFMQASVNAWLHACNTIYWSTQLRSILKSTFAFIAHKEQSTQL